MNRSCTHRPSRRVAALAAVMLLGACASTATTHVATPPARSLPPRVSSSDLARSLGLSDRGVDAAGRHVLTHRSGGRIVLYPGSALVSVRGRTLRAPDLVASIDGQSSMTKETAAAVRRAWRDADVSAGPYVALPPPPPVPAQRPTTARPRSRVATPSAGAAAATGRQVASAAERRAWAVPLRRPWRYIVIHHSATRSGSAASFHEAHKRRDWDGLGYNFVIGNGNGARDGQIEVGYRWRQQAVGAHAGNDLMNQRGIGVCLVGDFTRARPTARQMESLTRLCDFLSAYCDIPPQNLRLHRDFRDTACPGTYFPREFAMAPMRGVRFGFADAR